MDKPGQFVEMFWAIRNLIVENVDVNTVAWVYSTVLPFR